MFQDIRFGARVLLKNPGFSFIAILTLALGIGANTALFSVVNAVLLRPLPYQNADELAMFFFTNARGEEQWFVPPAAHENLNRHNGVGFNEVAAWGNDTWPANLTGDGEPERLQGFQVSANFFKVLGVSAARGRTFSSDAEDNRLVVISHDLWQRRFNQHPGVIGSSILLNGAAYDVIGVMPADFRFVMKTDVWTTLDFKAAGNRPAYLHQVFRLKPGVSSEQTRAEIESLLLPHVSDTTTDLRGELKPLQTILMGEDVRLLLFILFAAVAFVLLIACANIANLLLTRASVRRREMAIRAALGAGRLRIARQLLVESAMLAVIGGGSGLLLAKWCVGFLVSGLPPDVVAKNSNVAMLELDGWALGFAFALSLLTTVIFGLVPALQASRVNLVEALKEGERSRSQALGQSRLRSLLVMSEIAMAMVLLIGGGLMIKSLWRLNNVDRGFDSSGVLTANIDPSEDKYREPHQVVAFYEQLLERVSAIPGVQNAGITNGFLDRRWRIAVEEHPPVPQEQRPTASRHPVNPDYFRAMGIRLRAGRLFTDRDVQGALPVVIIDETLARRYFGNEDPIGNHLRFEDASREIVGVVAATRAWKRFTAGDVAAPRVYLPYRQEKPLPTMALIVRAQSGDPANLIPAIRGELAAIDRDQPIHSFKPLEQSVDELSANRRFSTLLLAAFAALAVLLAAVGIYGVMSYTVSRRTHEIGIRMALGAQAGSVIGLVMKQGTRLAITGVILGLIASCGLTRVMESLLFGVSALDRTTFALTTLLLVSVALLACYVPARRAAKLDPMIALRCE